MIPFKTTPEQALRLASIVVEMLAAGLDQSFIYAASELAREDQGIFDLLDLWLNAEGDEDERSEIVADIQASIDDYADAPREPRKKPYISYAQLDDVVQRVRIEKDKLRDLINQHGGVSAVARLCGIPQPSLSRMLNDASMPRRSTLYKIANALNLPETAIALEWTR